MYAKTISLVLEYFLSKNQVGTHILGYLMVYVNFITFSKSWHVSTCIDLIIWFGYVNKKIIYDQLI